VAVILRRSRTERAPPPLLLNAFECGGAGWLFVIRLSACTFPTKPQESLVILSKPLFADACTSVSRDLADRATRTLRVRDDLGSFRNLFVHRFPNRGAAELFDGSDEVGRLTFLPSGDEVQIVGREAGFRRRNDFKGEARVLGTSDSWESRFPKGLPKGSWPGPAYNNAMTCPLARDRLIQAALGVLPLLLPFEQRLGSTLPD
jgi:hypothetical protein